MSTSYKIAENLYMVVQTVPNTGTAKPVETNVNHVFICDASGSMSYEIERVREHLKTKVPKLMKEGDTLSLIAFSGRGQFWRILTAEPVATLADLSDVNKAIDRWLRPVGMTGFKEPIEDAAKLIGELTKNGNKNPFALTFMSDGYENQWSHDEVLKAIDKVGSSLASATVVSYGNYADLQFLTKMAERWGGTLVQSENFPKFQPVFDAIMQKKVVGGKKIEVQIAGDVIAGTVFGFDGDDIVTFGLEGDRVHVSPGVKSVVYLSPDACGLVGSIVNALRAENFESAATYAAIRVFAVRMRPDIVLPLLKATGDVAFIEQFSTLFGRQKYAEFQEAAAAAAVDPSIRLTKGYDPTRVPHDDAFTVMELVQLLQQDEENRVLLNHPSFRYNRIGRARVDSFSRFTDEEQAELDALNAELAKVKKNVAKTKEISAKIAALTAKPDPLKFEETPNEDGFSVDNLVFNEDRANVSIQITRNGTVDLSSRLPLLGDKLGGVPPKMSTFQIRSYAIIKDGIVNFDRLPVRCNGSTMANLYNAQRDGRLAANAIERADGKGYREGDAIINLRKIPIINRQMVKQVSARKLFETQWALTKAQAAQKVYNSFMKEMFPGKKSVAFEALYGKEASDWLAEQGFTDYSGFNPKVVQADSTDVYMAKKLEVKLAGYSTLPSLNDWRKQRDKKKFNGPGALMTAAAEDVGNFMPVGGVEPGTPAAETCEKWLKKQQKTATAECRKLLFEIAQIKFSIIVGQVWFSDMTPDQESMELTLDGNKLSFSVQLREVEEKV